MKLLRKIAPLAISALMLGATATGALAADLGTWQSTFTSSTTAVVVGSGAIGTSDMNAAITVAQKVGIDTTAPSITGESVSLGAGEDQIYLAGALNGNIATITDDDLANVLEDGTFEDDTGATFDYEQTIDMGARTFTFADSGNDLDNPALIIDVGDDTAAPLYTWTLTFTDALDFNDPDSEGEEIEFFGKKYTVGTATDADTLQLFGSGTELSLVTATPSGTATVSNVIYTVEVVGINTDGDQVTVKVTQGTTSETKTVTEATSKKINGINIFVKDANAFSGQAGNWQATILVGADELYFEDEAAVMSGSDLEDIEGTHVNIVGTCDAMTELTVAVAASDDDVDHLLAGQSFADPVFGSIKTVYSGIRNGPTISDDKGTDSNTARKSVKIEAADDLTLSATFEVKGNTGTVEFVNNADLEDADSNDLEVIEGATITEDEYFFLMSGNSQYLVQATKVNCDDDNVADDDVTLHNVFKTGTADDFKIEDKDLDAAAGTDWTIGGQTYSVTCEAANTVAVVSDDYGTDDHIYVYPYLETISNKDIRLAFTDEVTTPAITDTAIVFELPTGDLDDADFGGTFADGVADAVDAITIGTVTYIVHDHADDTVTIAIDEGQDAGDADDPEANPGILFVEEEDASDADVMNAVIIPTTSDGTYAEVDLNAAADNDDSTIEFTGTSVENQAFDNTDYAGSIDAWGTYLVEDTSDDDQDVAWFTYSGEQMYADVSVAESSAVGGTVWTAVKDNEAASYTGKNVIAIGGTAINKVARKILGLAEDTPVYGTDAAWKTATTVGTNSVDGLNKGFLYLATSPYASDKYALLVAGYEGADTEKTANFLTLKYSDLSGKTKAVIDTLNNVAAGSS